MYATKYHRMTSSWTNQYHTWSDIFFTKSFLFSIKSCFRETCLRQRVAPPTKRTCAINRDCLVSNWSTWKMLNHSCVTENGDLVAGFQVRTRTVMELPVAQGKPCPHLEETGRNEDKNPQKMCDKYVHFRSSLFRNHAKHLFFTSQIIKNRIFLLLIGHFSHEIIFI